MVQSRPSCKGSCFFPIIGNSRLSMSLRHIVDKTQTEVIRLQMRNSTGGATLEHDQRQVIGETDSGETHVLADYTGSFWSLWNSKWSLKKMNTSSADMPLFELLGPQVLDYEPKYYANLRSDKDYVTLVDFSKQHPYVKVVGLVDMKFGSVEVKENWLVLPGIVSTFILSAVLKKDSTNVGTAVAIIALEKGSGCRGGCSGECGNMRKAANASGCGSGCSGECGDMVNIAANASSCGSGCSSECGDMVKAANASRCGSGCSGECGDMVNAVKASGCGSGCSGECGEMMKAVKASGCGGSSGCGGGCGGWWWLWKHGQSSKCKRLRRWL
ncbi:PREDICTED: glycine-rich domain-containing protein 1-like [Camelina sativa]|uniref:Glycine-rich domain-containing protein 1-like n=1 Tax=Camelina sativa TaxID=90675 RepID=A0ABM1QQY4_CAMSA|nr:PREDICTED: glycine-rich domain-containing protein 1-like [Camelina sativa]